MSYPDNAEEPDRQNAMLTGDQRRFLLSDGSGYTTQNRYDYRKAIEQRVYNTILDFALLFDHWDKHDREGREQIINDIFHDPELKQGIHALIAMLYLNNPYTRVGGLQQVLLKGITQAERELSGSDMMFPVDVDLTVERVESADYEQAIRKFRKGKLSDLTDDETRALVRLFDKTPSVTAEELSELQGELWEYYQGEFREDFSEAVEERVDSAREKQARQRDREPTKSDE